MSEIIINLEGVSPVAFYGVNNSKLALLKRAFPKMKIVSRGNKIKLAGSEEDIELIQEKINLMMRLLERDSHLSDKQVEDLLSGEDGAEPPASEYSSDVLVHGRNGLQVKARTANQKKMVEVSEKNDIMFAIGPAGTGKTYTAVALAVRALKNKLVRKIILTRPAVEAGENLGFLPGDLKEKIDPYLRPLYDALDDMIPIEKLNYYMENRVIEVAPLAFMRGRTLDHSFILLDEAQNATHSQLKMFLTRIGPSAKCIITGDLTQIDLPRNQESGLRKAVDLLSPIEGIGTVYLNEGDVIRHRLVKQIVIAYNRDAEQNPPVERGGGKRW
ncbi:MAG: PhoH family protein [Chitinophagales bacterium]|nr:PhoH family protein [Chitinophagales bacterium]